MKKHILYTLTLIYGTLAPLGLVLLYEMLVNDVEISIPFLPGIVLVVLSYGNLFLMLGAPHMIENYTLVKKEIMINDKTQQ